MLLDRLDRELADEVAAKIRQHEERLKQQAEAKAREILAIAIQRYAAEHTADTTVSTVDIPSRRHEGPHHRPRGAEHPHLREVHRRGRDRGRHARRGDRVSAFDNVRRETARLALTKLIQDGRIHPTRIEEVVTETQEEMEKHILEIGKQAVLEADVGAAAREARAAARPAASSAPATARTCCSTAWKWRTCAA